MVSENLITELKTDHAGLEKKINEELGHLYPNKEIVADLKRKKLRIKDELQRLVAA
ncbi:MAG: YdcH family protein [Alphaproteobacteria bacterium]|jgi:hypothetical protein